jgi:hypothetical protein
MNRSLNDKLFYDKLNMDKLIRNVKDLYKNQNSNEIYLYEMLDNFNHSLNDIYIVNNIIQSFNSSIHEDDIRDIFYATILLIVNKYGISYDMLSVYNNKNIMNMIQNINTIDANDTIDNLFDDYANNHQIYKLIPVCYHILDKYSYVSLKNVLYKESKDEIKKLYMNCMNDNDKYKKIVNMTSYSKYIHDIQMNNMNSIWKHVSNKHSNEIKYYDLIEHL